MYEQSVKSVESLDEEKDVDRLNLIMEPYVDDVLSESYSKEELEKKKNLTYNGAWKLKKDDLDESESYHVKIDDEFLMSIHGNSSKLVIGNYRTPAKGAVYFVGRDSDNQLTCWECDLYKDEDGIKPKISEKVTGSDVSRTVSRVQFAFSKSPKDNSISIIDFGTNPVEVVRSGLEDIVEWENQE